MNNSSIQVFSFESQEVRTVNIGGAHWFVLRDVLTAMGSSTPPSRAAESILDGLGGGVNDGHPIVDSLGRTQQVTVISEPAVTFLVARSNTELGKQLNRWVHNEVLPSLRKTGSYSLNGDKEFVLNFEHMNRLKLYRRHTKIPASHFSIFQEFTAGTMADLEDVGYILPMRSVPDISVGKRFCAYLRSKGISVEDNTLMYKHYYPDGRIVDANIYDVALLPMFRVWMQDEYNVKHLPKYLLAKDANALQPLSELLGLPVAELMAAVPRPKRKALAS